MFFSFFLLFLSLAPNGVFSVPRFSWDVAPAYQHCANTTGLFNTTQLAVFANKSFVVLEKTQCINCDPPNQHTEAKIIQAAKQIKEGIQSMGVSPPSVYFYYQIDWTRSNYDSGVWFEHHPDLLMMCDQQFIFQPDLGYVYALSKAEARSAWVDMLVATYEQGWPYLDGFFIDGFQTPYTIATNCTQDELAAWAQGMSLTIDLLHERLSSTKQKRRETMTTTNDNNNNNEDEAEMPDTVIITNPKSSLQSATGFMVETFYPDNEGIFALRNASKYMVEVHADLNHGTNWAWEVTFAAFLIGMEEYQYFGDGHDWSDCSTWSWKRPEYFRPLGKPMGLAVQDGNVWNRSFSSGTKVWLNTTQTIECCIQWSDGTTTGQGGPCAELLAPPTV